MNIIITPKNVIWEFQGIDDGYVFQKNLNWNKLSLINSSACEYAYQNNIDMISTHEGEYHFDLIKMEMYVNTTEFISPFIKIRRSL